MKNTRADALGDTALSSVLAQTTGVRLSAVSGSDRITCVLVWIGGLDRLWALAVGPDLTF